MTYVRDLCRGTALAHPLGAAIALFAALMVASLIGALASPEEWVGFLPTTLGAAEQGAVWIGALAAASSAWVAGQPRAHGFREWTGASPRPSAARLGRCLGFTAVLAVAAFSVSVGIMLAVSAYYGLSNLAENSDLFLIVPTMWGYLLFWSACGVMLGEKLRRELALPVAAVTPYIAYAAVALYAGEGPLSAFAVGDGRSYDYVRPTLSFLIARGVFWIALGLAFVALVLQQERLRLTLGWVASIGAAIVIFQGSAFDELSGALTPTCTGTAPTVCLDGSHASTLNRYHDAARKVWSATPAPLRPDAIGSSPEVLAGQSGRTLVVPPERGFTSPSRLIDASAFAGRYGDELLLRQCNNTGSSSTDAAFSLVIWWRLTRSITTDGTAFPGDLDYKAALPAASDRFEQARALKALSAPEREAWFAANAAAIQDCASLPRPFDTIRR